MEMGFGLIQQQQLKLVMTPELRQSITILQYSAMELSNYLREQANENPLIEITEPVQFRVKEERHTQNKASAWEDIEGIRYGDYSISKQDYVNPIDYYAERRVSLQHYLQDQLRYMTLRPTERKLLLFLIGNLNEIGYLDADFQSLPADYHVSLEEFENAVYLLQQLEPYGIGARNLTECLLIQLRHSDCKDALCEYVILHHLSDLAANRFQKVASKLKISVAEVQEIADLIKGFDPKPGARFYSQYDTRFIVPDVFVQKGKKGQFYIQMNDGILPLIQMNSEYQELIEMHQEAKEFLDHQLNQLHWLKKSIDQRKQTILKVTEMIVKEQRRFFEGDENILKPLTLKEVARKLDIHESTVSRATNHKYVQTPKGIYELKHFFTNGIASDNGEATSSQYIKELIKRLIDDENKKKPLSDQKIVQILDEKQGIQIARRTVAKYREELGILSSSMRKRF